MYLRIIEVIQEPSDEEDDSDASADNLDDSEVIFNFKPNGKKKKGRLEVGC